MIKHILEVAEQVETLRCKVVQVGARTVGIIVRLEDTLLILLDIEKVLGEESHALDAA